MCPQYNGLPGGGFCALQAFGSQIGGRMIRKGKLVLLGVITAAALVVVSSLVAAVLASF